MTRRTIRALIAAAAFLLLPGCGGEKYRLSFENSGFEAPKEMYAPGERVKVTYNLIGTDTDYTFYSDDVEFKQDYDPKQGYILRFVMPDHDVTLGVNSYSSMTYLPEPGMDPDPENIWGTKIPDDGSGERWFCPECGTENYGQYCSSCGLERPE